MGNSFSGAGAAGAVGGLGAAQPQTPVAGAKQTGAPDAPAQKRCDD